MSTFSDFLNDAAIQRQAVANALVRSREARESLNQIKKIAALLDETEDANAANLAIRYALAEQLRRVDPSNPMLVDGDLRDRVSRAAKMAFRTTGRNYDAAREVGRTFKIPGR